MVRNDAERREIKEIEEIALPQTDLSAPNPLLNGVRVGVSKRGSALVVRPVLGRMFSTQRLHGP
jgi:hypothetical protein